MKKNLVLKIAAVLFTFWIGYVAYIATQRGRYIEMQNGDVLDSQEGVQYEDDEQGVIEIQTSINI